MKRMEWKKRGEGERGSRRREYKRKGDGERDSMIKVKTRE
jgi:hypothetical protein